MAHMLTNLAVFFDSSDKGLRVLEITADLASEQNAHRLSIIVSNHCDELPAQSFARGDALSEVIQRLQSSQALCLLHADQYLNSAATRSCILPGFRVILDAKSGNDVALFALYSDLLMAGHPNAPGAPKNWSPNRMLARTGVPLLLLRGETVVRRITVAWNASSQARRALADVLPILISAKEVQLLIVVSEQHAGLQADEVSSAMAASLARLGVKVDLQRILSHSKSTADTTVAQAQDNQSDLIVFGACSHPCTSGAVFGGVARILLTDTSLPSFISH